MNKKGENVLRLRLNVPERIRTSDFTLRRRALYPAELQGHGMNIDFKRMYYFISNTRCQLQETRIKQGGINHLNQQRGSF